MASYQDLETRMRVVEDKLNFLMDAMGQQSAEQTGMIDPTTNQPVIKVTRKTFNEIYREFKNAQLQALAAKANWDRRSAGEVGGEVEPEATRDTGSDTLPVPTTSPKAGAIHLTDQ